MSDKRLDELLDTLEFVVAAAQDDDSGAMEDVLPAKEAIRAYFVESIRVEREACSAVCDRRIEKLLETR
jgi:hypothetical protein